MLATTTATTLTMSRSEKYANNVAGSSTIFFEATMGGSFAEKLYNNEIAGVHQQVILQRSYNTFLIHPGSKFKLWSDIVLSVFILANTIIMPLDIAFLGKDDPLYPYVNVWNWCSDIYFILDIFVVFRTGVVTSLLSGTVSMDPKVIAKTYAKGFLTIDVLSSLPFDRIFEPFENDQASAIGQAIKVARLTRYIRLLRLLRVSRLNRTAASFEGDNIVSVVGVMVRLVNEFIVLVVVAHWSACIQFLVPAVQGFPRDSWVQLNDLTLSPWYEQYTAAFLQGVSHAVEAGYGRIAPKRTEEMWVTVMSVLTG